jgi:hypothetical protein
MSDLLSPPTLPCVTLMLMLPLLALVPSAAAVSSIDPATSIAEAVRRCSSSYSCLEVVEQPDGWMPDACAADHQSEIWQIV